MNSIDKENKINALRTALSLCPEFRDDLNKMIQHFRAIEVFKNRPMSVDDVTDREKSGFNVWVYRIKHYWTHKLLEDFNYWLDKKDEISTSHWHTIQESKEAKENPETYRHRRGRNGIGYLWQCRCKLCHSSDYNAYEDECDTYETWDKISETKLDLDKMMLDYVQIKRSKSPYSLKDSAKQILETQIKQWYANPAFIPSINKLTQKAKTFYNENKHQEPVAARIFYDEKS